MSEQEIDAELLRYEPWRVDGVRGTFWVWLRVPEDGWYAERHMLFPSLWRRCYRPYPTRAAAFAGLRQAIRAGFAAPVPV